MSNESSRRPLYPHVCQYCGITFHRPKVATRPQKYCSRSCQGKGVAARRGHDTLFAQLAPAVEKRRGVVDYSKKQAKWRRNGRHLVAMTQDSAHRRGYHWTGPELEIAARDDLTAIQIAQMLGRTAYAVKHIRRKLAIDPRKQAAL